MSRSFNDLRYLLRGQEEEIDGKAFSAAFVAANALTAGDVCILKAGGMDTADKGSSADAAGLLGVAETDVASSATGRFVLHGFIAKSGFTAGQTLYLGDAGDMTSTVPIVSGDIVRPVGYAISASLVYFDPDKTWIEVS